MTLPALHHNQELEGVCLLHLLQAPGHHRTVEVRPAPNDWSLGALLREEASQECCWILPLPGS